MKIETLAIPFLLALTPAAGVSAKPAQGKVCSPNHRADAEAFVDLYFEIWNDHDLSRLDEILTPDSINHNPFGTMDVDELAGIMGAFFAAFPDLTYTVQRVVVEKDHLVIEYTYTGTHLGDLLGLPPTGVVVHGRGLELHVMDDGRIAETFNYSDAFGLYAQLGLL
jgi:steroid delta-isomerase-like uncharacterized protein